VFGKSRDRFCAPQLKGILVVANSHSNKDEQPDAPLQLSVGAAISRDNGDATMAVSAATDGSYSRRDFPNILSTMVLCRTLFSASQW